jgi:hypothetical protein
VTVLEPPRLDRAVKGVGAPIWDFLGVSIGLLRLLELRLGEESRLLAADGDGLVSFLRLLAMNG